MIEGQSGREDVYKRQSEDRAYAGVNVVRDSFGNVIRMYVQKGYAGNRLLYVKGKEQEGENNNYTRYTQDDWFNDQGKGRWILKRVEREDTDLSLIHI